MSKKNAEVYYKWKTWDGKAGKDSSIGFGTVERGAGGAKEN